MSIYQPFPHVRHCIKSFERVPCWTLTPVVQDQSWVAVKSRFQSRPASTEIDEGPRTPGFAPKPGHLSPPHPSLAIVLPAASTLARPRRALVSSGRLTRAAPCRSMAACRSDSLVYFVFFLFPPSVPEQPSPWNAGEGEKRDEQRPMSTVVRLQVKLWILKH